MYKSRSKMTRISVQNARLKRQRIRPGREPARHVQGRHRQKIKPRPVETAEPTYYYGDEYEEGYVYNYENEADPKPLRPRRPSHKEFTYRKPGGKQRVRQTNTISNPPSANNPDDSYYYSQVGCRVAGRGGPCQSSV